jgi:uncharacterized protein
MRSGWLLCESNVVCALEITETFAERARGLQGRESCDGALHLAGARTVHTAGMLFELDVAFLSADLTVVQLVRVPPWRVALPRKGTRSVLQAEAGALARWGVRVADRLEIHEVR